MKFLKKALPHLVAIVVFAAISALLFAPQYSGKAMGQHDMIQANGATEEFKEHIQKHGEHPQWAGRMFSGMPAYLLNMNYDGRYVKNIADQTYFIGQPAAFIFVAMVTFYLMLLMFGVNAWIAIIGGLGYGLSTYFPIIIAAGHITKMMALAWIPALIGAIYFAYRKKMWMGGALAGIFASIVISTSHPQILYYFLFVILALAINEFIRAYKEKTIRSFIATSCVLLVAGGLAIGSNAVQLYYVADHSTETIRGRSELGHKEAAEVATSGLDKDYATAWSYGIGESFNLFIPRLMGEGNNSGFSKDGEVAQSLKKYEAAHIAPQLPSYWGEQPSTNGSVYIGAMFVFLFVLGMFILKASQKWWLFSAMVLGLLLAWGHNAMWLTNFFLDYVPMYNKFRTPSMILVILQLAIPLMAILAIQKIVCGQNNNQKQLLKGLMWAYAICGGFALFTAAILPNFLSFSGPNDGQIGIPEDVITAMQHERQSMMVSDALRAFMIVTICGGVILLLIKKKLKIEYAMAILVVVAVIDLFQVDRRFIKIENFQPKREALAIKPTQNDIQILKDTTNYRVANFTLSPFSDATTSYFHRSIGGYHAAKLRRYQDLIDFHLAKQNMPVYDMLNTKYFITKDGVVQNPNALGNAWFVDSVQFVDSADDEIAALGEGFNPKTTAVIDKRFKNQVEGINLIADTTAKINLTSYKTNEVVYTYQAKNKGVVIFSEIYFPKGWSVKIDGEESDYFRADYVLRAMAVPSGKHTITWTFKAPHFELLVNITRTCSIILIIGTLFLITFTALKNRKKQ